jgi:regulator of sigma E protease
MLSFLAPILVFGLVVFVHELGHFLAAKAVGVYAPRFSIGFGPALWRRRRGETEYILAAFPLGGYVRMASRHDEETAFLEGGSEEKTKRGEGESGYDPEAMIPFGPKPVPEHRWFESKPLWARLLIMIAGVAMNILLSIVVLGALALQMGRAVVPTTVVGDVRPIAAVPSLTTALQPGDTIRTVNGTAVTTWNQVVREIGDASGDALTLQTQRGPVRIPLGGAGGTTPDALMESIQYQHPPVLDSLLSDRPAARAGLRKGDRVTAIDGTPIQSWPQLVRRISASPGKEVTLDVQRDGIARRIAVRPESARGPDLDTGMERTVGRIGAFPVDFVRREPVGPVEAAVAGWDGTWATAGRVISFLKQLFAGELSVRQLGGPVAITRASVSAAQSGAADLFFLIAFLSVNVAILNLLPIPILDGGQIVLNVVEAVKGSPFSMRTREYILRVGLAAIALLFVIVMFNDIAGLVGRLFG